ncbi:MAG: hypothetical protein ACLFVO_03480 [Chloroflexaceae bacterium]
MTRRLHAGAWRVRVSVAGDDGAGMQPLDRNSAMIPMIWIIGKHSALRWG